MDVLQNSAGTGRQLAKDGCAVMDHQMRSHLHPQAGGLTHGLSRHSGLSDSHLHVPHTLTRRSPRTNSSRVKIQSSTRAILADTTCLRVGSHCAPVLRALCKDLGSVNLRGAKNMTRVDRHRACVGGAEVSTETQLPPPKRQRLSSAWTGSSQTSSPCGNPACPLILAPEGVKH